MIVTEHCNLMRGCMFSTWRFSGFSGFQSKHQLETVKLLMDES